MECWLFEGETILVQEGEIDLDSDVPLVRPWIWRIEGRFVIQDGAPGGVFTSVDRCGIRTDGTIACWDTQTADTHSLVSGLPEGTFTSIAVNNSNACAVRTDGTIACWGSTELYDDTHQLVSGLPEGTFTSVSVGDGYACAIRSDRSIACWGDPRWGRDGYGYDGEPTPVPPGTFKAVTVSTGHACAIRTDGTIACWGADANGWLDAPHGTFTAIDTSPPAWQGAGWNGGHTAAVSSDGRVAFWGSTSSWDCCG